MAHRVQRGDRSMRIPWVTPIKDKSDVPKEILTTIDMTPSAGPLRRAFGVKIVRLQSDSGGEFI
eukprot:735786-Prorocentrum_lima.AAC.1